MRSLTFAAALLLAACASAPDETASVSTAGIAPSWEAARIAPILERTQRLHLAPDVSALTPGEQAAVRELIAAGERMHALYLDQRHPQALAAAAYLDANPDLEAARELFRLNAGPIATTLDNTREPFLTVRAETPARNVYPPDLTRAEMDAFLAANPSRRADILDDRTVVWTATPENRERVRRALERYPVLQTLHPGIWVRIIDSTEYLAVPYSIAYADDIMFIYERLNGAAQLVENDDPAFARYLRLRARDLLADDYEGGDAAWVTGEFTGNLNAQIGAYETYDDALYGVKTFFSLSLLVRDRARSDELGAALADIQIVENALP